MSLPLTGAGRSAASIRWWSTGGCPDAAWADVWSFDDAANRVSAITGKLNGTVLTDIAGVAAWTSGVGLTFTGSEYLDTGIIPASGYSIIIQFSAASDGAAINEYDIGAANSRSGLWPNYSGKRYYHAGQAGDRTPGKLAGNMAIIGQQPYLNGVVDGGAIGAWGNLATISLYIGARHREAPTNADAPFIGNIQRVGIAIGSLAAYMPDMAIAMRGSATLMVAFGDSVTAGSGASDAAHSWPNLVAVDQGWILQNSGLAGSVLQNTVQNTVAVIGGAVTSNGRDNYTLWVTAYSPDYVFILYGLNDLRLNDVAFTDANFANDLGEVVDGIVASGIAADHIILGSPPHMVDYAGYSPYDAGSAAKQVAYTAATAAVATAKGTLYADIYQAMLDNGGDALVSGDGVHPNDAGHAVIANAFLAVL